MWVWCVLWGWIVVLSVMYYPYIHVTLHWLLSMAALITQTLGRLVQLQPGEIRDVAGLEIMKNKQRMGKLEASQAGNYSLVTDCSHPTHARLIKYHPDFTFDALMWWWWWRASEWVQSTVVRHKPFLSNIPAIIRTWIDRINMNQQAAPASHSAVSLSSKLINHTRTLSVIYSWELVRLVSLESPTTMSSWPTLQPTLCIMDRVAGL